ncbi:MAG: deoxyribose-phosphate aldolase [Pirellulaceae bacterium]
MAEQHAEQYSDFSKMIDHSLLMPTLDQQQLAEGCKLAVAYDVASVCILPYFLRKCSELLSGSSVQPSTTIGFPHGGHTTYAKQCEAERAIEDGCQELDMVINISQALSQNWDYVANEIHAIVSLAHTAERKVKVIFENCYLQDEHKIRLCNICTDIGADWVKTSTGYGTGGATLEDLQLMLRHVGPGVQVKAAGGVRDFESLQRVRALGVTRCGASATQKMMDQARAALGLEPIEFDITSAASGY